jgi:predicted metalloprotease with PDZ domain
MHYKISYDNPNRHFIDISLQLEAQASDSILRLPSWRPGRYQIQNFARNIKGLSVKDRQGKVVDLHKISKDGWQLRNKPGRLTITYSYYAFVMDAGNSWLDDQQLYINFINLAIYAEGHLNQPCTVTLDLPASYKVATGLQPETKNTYSCPSYYQLVDSPLIASATLRQITYGSGDYKFNIWIQGDLPQTEEKIIEDFKPFTDLQIDVMGGFPCEEYHFLCQCLPYKHYHGVEHWNSTVITLGPSEELKERALYKELLGVSCHELFHTWNVIRLRPKEMTPYNFQAENYHETGFVTEGITTYYGDLFLVRAGVFDQEEYMGELNKLLKRHYDNDGRKHYSVAASSYDLWLDGYERGIPGRKVSIYNEGALAAIILDLKIRLKYQSEKSLDDVMRLMWQRHGANLSGYSYADYQNAAESVYGESLADYFEQIIKGMRPYEYELESLLPAFGLSFELKAPRNTEEADFGIRIIQHDDRFFIDQLAAGSAAELQLSTKDEILSVNGEVFKGVWPESDLVALEVNRFGRKLSFALEKESQMHFPVYQVSVNEEASEEEKKNLANWFHKK